jgi:two-component system nitrogen regulation response regulator NtrX
MSKGKLLVVDDEDNLRASLRGILQDEGYQADAVASGETCLEKLKKNKYDAIFLDIWLPGKDGIEILKEIRSRRPSQYVIMISGHGTIETAVQATKLGAFDFIEKPLSLEKVMLVLRHAFKQKLLEDENRTLKDFVRRETVMIGSSVPMKALRQQVEYAAPTEGRILIYGENGTGKELVATLLHLNSPRKKQPFVEVNCAAIPDDLIENELFGSVKGAYTGATESRKGKFGLADRGTLFLDEVGDMSLKTQAKVLRVLEEQRFYPVGSNDAIEVDVRVIAATNKNLEQEIEKETFRQDLFLTSAAAMENRKSG